MACSKLRMGRRLGRVSKLMIQDYTLSRGRAFWRALRGVPVPVHLIAADDPECKKTAEVALVEHRCYNDGPRRGRIWHVYYVP